MTEGFNRGERSYPIHVALLIQARWTGMQNSSLMEVGVLIMVSVMETQERAQRAADIATRIAACFRGDIAVD
jgi:hypothetical protein